ncbi:Sua5 YciO YrdC YwlC family protein [Campylobacter sp. LH-2024]|uniref:Sua5 YciO YrdC YwlC family protein n=1 Tax=Campylobacter molothri TaxID=1032242 RepID=A0ACC5W0V5_9BACT|nr:Sua5 YciO YrdC YwlC family protein [Campylobacter sp. RM10537]MBZ7927916.1 Sua5 YciO YrdC YwlC family protein [Campylobacter sp. RM10542]MBZ7934163.1 Sua5 YciO YrdC YwlC family protein [Campylobacter sp. W0065]MBZ7950662.1 Sua5 YciO YrdC YwlC family protein [Campylobacter sp. W0046]MBZ7958045.1 Sua5 YciO YrdC YwlC family protein [Campylobacter sp. RM9760]MBZ7965623.1 Sua5 YciO YrdC YwlC family protein [Campylobacter sp. RM10535]MBZ7974182.1 Sua5 YciO YrdC YwlC family protein [Campylobacter
MIYLAQTDTTAGFLSKNLEEINILKGRAKDKPCLITSAKLSELQNLTRVPKGFKNLVRRAKKTTFIYPNHQAIRIVKDCKHAEFLSQNGFFYSSSANQHGKKFDEIWAKSVADVILDQFFFEGTPSKILKIRGKRKLKIR